MIIRRSIGLLLLHWIVFSALSQNHQRNIENFDFDWRFARYGLQADGSCIDEQQNRPTSRSSYFGIVDLAGFPKDRYYLYQSRWRSDHPMVHILPHWNFEDRIGKNVPVFVYSSGDEVELFLNGKSLGRKQKRPYEYRFRWDSVQYVPGELKAIAYKHGQE